LKPFTTTKARLVIHKNSMNECELAERQTAARITLVLKRNFVGLFIPGNLHHWLAWVWAAH
jgi:hypothetical protein